MTDNTNTAWHEWLDAKEGAGYLKLKSHRTLLKMAREGRVKAQALFGTKRKTWRFRREWLDELGARMVPPSVVLTEERRSQ